MVETAFHAECRLNCPYLVRLEQKWDRLRNSIEFFSSSRLMTIRQAVLKFLHTYRQTVVHTDLFQWLPC